MPSELPADALLRDIETIAAKPVMTPDDIRALAALQASLNRQKFAAALSPDDEIRLKAANRALEEHGIFTED